MSTCGTVTDDAIIIINAQTISIMLATLNPIIKTIPLTSKIIPRIIKNFSGIILNNPKIQKHIAIKMSKIPSNLTNIAFLNNHWFKNVLPPWRNWITQQHPKLKITGSTPVGGVFFEVINRITLDYF